jgi:hypothetical protein
MPNLDNLVIQTKRQINQTREKLKHLSASQESGMNIFPALSNRKMYQEYTSVEFNEPEKASMTPLQKLFFEKISSHQKSKLRTIPSRNVQPVAPAKIAESMESGR